MGRSCKEKDTTGEKEKCTEEEDVGKGWEDRETEGQTHA